jgi:hypothetical protein
MFPAIHGQLVLAPRFTRFPQRRKRLDQASGLSRFSLPRPKYILFAFIALMVAYVLGHNKRFLIDSKDAEWPHIQSFKW